MFQMIKSERIFNIKTGLKREGTVVYWMSRDQRVNDNRAMLFARELALKFNQNLAVVFCLTNNFPGATLRHYDFMLKGLQEVESCLKKKNIPFYLLPGNPSQILTSFIDEFPPLQNQNETGIFKFKTTDWISSLKFPSADVEVPVVKWLRPGENAAREILTTFLDLKLERYNEQRNDPNEDASSNLSPYLHFGQISAQRVAIEIMKNIPGNENTESFLEELIIRRELSDNYCFYNPDYDRFGGFPEWARKTLNEHRMDEREYLYNYQSFENAQTHDLLWNAAQMEMVKSGKMHGYMRMYWAKKILEWTRSPEEALDFSLRLNDRYQLDGRDSNGFVGCAWSIGGVHDRAWTERAVYGKIRYMNYNGCKRKFDVERYISKWLKSEYR
jgi:deoxyribodipyrimidine photo-lyase